MSIEDAPPEEIWDCWILDVSGEGEDKKFTSRCECTSHQLPAYETTMSIDFVDEEDEDLVDIGGHFIMTIQAEEEDVCEPMSIDGVPVTMREFELSFIRPTEITHGDLQAAVQRARERRGELG